MAEQQNLLLNPLFRYGMPAMSAVVIVAVAFLIIEDQTVRMAMLLVAAVEIFVIPWVLKRAGKEQATDSQPHNV
jgi:ABC-type transport system involved in cytochrome bd biosynthesis fused ATPase/permease subunit